MIFELTPTGEAIVGTPTAIYNNAFIPHLPCRHGSSGSGMIPISYDCSSSTSRSADHRLSSISTPGKENSPPMTLSLTGAMEATLSSAFEIWLRSSIVVGLPLHPITSLPFEPFPATGIYRPASTVLGTIQTFELYRRA